MSQVTYWTGECLECSYYLGNEQCMLEAGECDCNTLDEEDLINYPEGGYNPEEAGFYDE